MNKTNFSSPPLGEVGRGLVLLNITLPQSWQSLNDKQLRYVFSLLADDFSSIEVKTLFLLRFGHIRVDRRIGNMFVVKHDKKEYLISARQMAECLSSLSWLDDIPGYPIRIKRIGWHNALSATFDNVPFDKYLCLENLYQGFLHTQNRKLLREMAHLMYIGPRGFRLRLSKAEEISVFYWFASLKQYLTRSFPHFLQSKDTSEPTSDIHHQLLDSMNAQIRALTAGDITKEKEVLAMDTWRALTELDAKARDYEEMQKQVNSHKCSVQY